MHEEHISSLTICSQDAITVNVKKRGFSAKLIPENILIGISRPLDLRLLFADFDNSGSTPNVREILSVFIIPVDCFLLRLLGYATKSPTVVTAIMWKNFLNTNGLWKYTKRECRRVLH